MLVMGNGGGERGGGSEGWAGRAREKLQRHERLRWREDAARGGRERGLCPAHLLRRRLQLLQLRHDLRAAVLELCAGEQAGEVVSG